MHPRAAPFAQAPRLIVKVGSSLLVADDGAPRREWLDSLAADIAAAHARGQRIVLVSSGAIALGARLLDLPAGGRASLEDAQAAASVGQITLAGLYAELFAARGLTAAQLLLTLDDLEDRRRFLNASATLDRLLTLGCVPVINENDSVATGEIRFGDNDRLAARVAIAAHAPAVLLLSDVDGLYTANPASAPGATLIETVPDLAALDADTRGASATGTGGMAAKLVAARLAAATGTWLAIAGGRAAHPLARFLESGRGTLFPPPATAPARAKSWLHARARAQGRLHVDPGAATALAGGASLLAAGLVRVEGQFSRGDVVEIVAPDGRAIARGLAAYDAAEAARIAGTRTAAQSALLGYAPRTAVVHRDHLVLL